MKFDHSILKKALDLSSADMTQVTFAYGESALTRFANSSIHQNVAEKNTHLLIKAVVDKRTGFASTNQIDDASIAHTVEKAVYIARYSQANEDFVSLPKPQLLQETDSYDCETADYTPEDRALAVKSMLECADQADASAAGTFTTGYDNTFIMNSLGVNSACRSSIAGLTTVMTSGDGYGYADRISRRVADINPVETAIEAAQKSVKSRNPQSIAPGEYDVILMPYAVGELLEFLAYTGFSALAVQESRSFMCGRIGQKIAGDSISIWDDGLDPAGLPTPFDAEGMPKKRVDFIVNGVANGVVYDSFTANRENRVSTGHASGGTGSYGPIPQNMFMKPGNTSLDEMVASTRKGILVTRFHYCNIIHPIQTLITGMTRDGTFLIENGEITTPLKNLRFTDGILERLSNVDMISKETYRQPMSVVPAIKARGFKFTGATEF
ncbi:MAG: TldD/PmbA family protein [Armatimonadota bacterium]